MTAQRKAAQECISRELYERGYPDIGRLVIGRLLHQMPDADMITIRVEKVFDDGDTDNGEGSRTLRGSDSQAEPPERAADQVSCPHGQECVVQSQSRKAGHQLPCMRVRRWPNQRHHGEGEPGL